MAKGKAPTPVPVTNCDCGDHCFAPISGGFNVLVSPEDAHVLARRWTGDVNPYGYVIVARKKWLAPKTFKKVVLAREIVAAPDGFEVDHVNGDSLDNRRGNLRVCTRAENAKNRKRTRGSANPYKGIRRHHNKFTAYIKCDGVSHYLGSFASADEAREAYSKAAKRLHGEFARAA